MMISPDSYYEFVLKGKTKDELMTEIRSLKREINCLKRSIEADDPSYIEVCPSRLTKIKCSRDYLEKAIQAYEEAGGEYKPTHQEQKSRDFDEALWSMEKMVFSIGGFFGGYETRTYSVVGDKVFMNVDHTLKDEKAPATIAFTKEEFITGITELHIGEWKKSYSNPLILDGTQWELEFIFCGKTEPVRIDGSNSYPYNFNDLLDYLGLEEDDEDGS